MNNRHFVKFSILAAILFASLPVYADVISLESEIRIGREVASEVEQELPISRDPLLNARVRRIGRRLAMVSGRPELPFEFHVVNAPEVNAFALPGGFVYVYQGLLQAVPSDDALAFIIAHEITHATRRHSLRQFKKNTIVEILSLPLRRWLGAGGRDWLRIIMMQLYSREDETEADRLGLQNAVRAGFSPDGGPQAMDTLMKMMGKGGLKILVLLQDHPATDSRLRKLRAQANALRNERMAAPDKPDPSAPPALPPAIPQEPVPPLPGIRSVPPLLVSASSPQPLDPWLPLSVGSRWRYAVTDESGGQSDSTVKVLERIPGEPAIFRVEVGINGVIYATSRMASRPDAIFRLQGDAWETDWDFTGGNKFRVLQEESVSVPHGTHQALLIEKLGADGKPECRAWFAKGIGLIKRQSLVTGITESLVSYEMTR